MERTGRKDNGASWRGVPARRMVGRPPVETEMNKDKAMQQALEQPPLPVQPERQPLTGVLFTDNVWDEEVGERIRARGTT